MTASATTEEEEETDTLDTVEEGEARTALSPDPVQDAMESQTGQAATVSATSCPITTLLPAATSPPAPPLPTITISSPLLS